MSVTFKLVSASIRAVAQLSARHASEGDAHGTAPSRRSERAFAAVAYRGFNISVLISVALPFGLLTVDTHAVWIDCTRLVFGTVLMGEGLLLATDWRGARRLVLWRLRHRRSAADHTRISPFGRFAWMAASPTVQLLGVIWLTAGTLAGFLGLAGVV